MKDLTNIWGGLNKPSGLENCEIKDYFDFQFTALPHKILMPEPFNQQVDLLRSRFSLSRLDLILVRFVNNTDENYVFHPTYHKRIPVDGIHFYAKQCWDQIIANKDLDLPTQQVLLAQYRCDEIASIALDVFDAAVKPLEQSVRTDAIISGLGEKMQAARKTTLEDFETQAQRYHKETFDRKLEELTRTVDLRLHVLFRAQLSGLHAVCIKGFQSDVETSLKNGGEFGKTVSGVKDRVMRTFDLEAQSLLVKGTDWTYGTDRNLLEEEVNALTSRLRKDEIAKNLEKLERQVKKELEEPTAMAFAKPTEKMWDELMGHFDRVKERKVGDFMDKAGKELGATEDDVKEGVDAIRVRAWSALRDRLESECEPTHLLLRLREL